MILRAGQILIKRFREKDMVFMPEQRQIYLRVKIFILMAVLNQLLVIVMLPLYLEEGLEYWQSRTLLGQVTGF